MRRLVISLASAAMVACGLSGARAEEPDIAHGKALVETNCAKCHAYQHDDVSPNPAAPPFRDLSKRYPVDALQEAFAEGIVTGHEEMPEFEATPRQIADIIAYLASIQPK
ncbi:cytochrome C [Zhengella mangrovi]|uniref:Cytochrome C n=1 Tax=Zhengella mangrovi TaxID=1982044 RepID=A0A2G1QP69_9HYPH|nr:cytochrome c [Zhengella mangrovi]PHP67326.1 cytochrome C [Zhengella mangrovi]